MTTFWKNKKVLVTGGTGFIGSSLTPELLERGSVVTIASHAKAEENSNFSEIKILNADLKNLQDCIEATRNIDIVIHLAAMDGGQKFKKEHAFEILETNTKITLNILEASKQNTVKRFLMMSSVDVYPDKVKSPIEEQYGLEGDLDKNRFGYAWSKRFGEEVAKVYHGRNGLKIAIARTGNVFGPHDLTGLERTRVIPTFIHKALNNEDISISANNKRSFLYVSDLAESLLELIEKYAACEAVNLAGVEYISLEDLAKLIISISKSKSRIIIENKDKNINERIISTSRAEKVISFSPKITLENGIRRLIEEKK